MNILINCSNLKKGGGVQVASSVCCGLNMFPQHHYTVILPDVLQGIQDIVSQYRNVTVMNYNSMNNLYVMLTGRDRFLDQVIEDNNIDGVISIFGPISWSPKKPHLCGFARSHLVLENSPFFMRMSFRVRMFSYFKNRILKYFFIRGVNAFYTENKFISERWAKLSEGRPVYTITNYYNQIYDTPSLWQELKLPNFEGVTILCISAYYAHKNLEIAIDIAKELRRKHPNFSFRFVFSINKEQYPVLPQELEPHFLFLGRVDLNQCPALYEQADIMFQPSLLECFSANYPEAMRMNVPIVSSNLEFARGLCGNAAIYYDALDASDAANKIYEVGTNKSLRLDLINEGTQELSKFNDYKERIQMLINCMEELLNNKLYN